MSGPVRDYRTPVLREWIDENDHMDSLHYKTVANGGTLALFRYAGLTREWLAQSGSTLFQLEMHVCYERELRLGDEIVVNSWLIGADAKRIHHFHEIMHEGAGYRAATVELMTLHVSRETRRSAPMPEPMAARFQEILAVHRALPQPSKVGRAISMAPS